MVGSVGGVGEGYVGEGTGLWGVRSGWQAQSGRQEGRGGREGGSKEERRVSSWVWVEEMTGIIGAVAAIVALSSVLRLDASSSYWTVYS
jgi:hypothetical protein